MTAMFFLAHILERSVCNAQFHFILLVMFWISVWSQINFRMVQCAIFILPNSSWCGISNCGALFICKWWLRYRTRAGIVWYSATSLGGCGQHRQMIMAEGFFVFHCWRTFTLNLGRCSDIIRSAHSLIGISTTSRMIFVAKWHFAQANRHNNVGFLEAVHSSQCIRAWIRTSIRAHCLPSLPQGICMVRHRSLCVLDMLTKCSRPPPPAGLVM